MSLSPPYLPTGPSDLRLCLAPGPFEEGAYVRVYCPYHEDESKAGGAVYADHFFCFTCSRWASRKEFLSLLSQTDSIQAVTVVQGGSSSSQPVSASLAEGYARILWGPRRDRVSWLLERGLDEHTIRTAGIGHTGRAFTIPVYVPLVGSGLQDSLAAIKYRHDPAFDTCSDECTCPKYTNSGGSKAALYQPGIQQGIHQGLGGPLALCEGEFDSLILSRFGIRAASLTSGAGAGTEALEAIKGESVVICYDMDRPGQRGALRVRDYLRPHARIATWHVERDDKGRVLPGYPKDVSDFVLQHGIERFKKLVNL